MIIASMLIASSVNMLYTTTTALDEFKKISNVADNIIMTMSDKENEKKLENWANSSDKVKSISSEDSLVVTADDITIPSQYEKLEDTTTLILSKIPKKYNLIFNQNDESFTLETGEIALPMVIKESTGIQLGDKVKVKLGDYQKEFTLKHYIKDIVFGSGLMSSKRIMLSDNDFNDFFKLENKVPIKFWSVIKNEAASYDDVERDFSKTSIRTVSNFNSDTVSFTYIMDLITAAVMIVVSIFLILISFLILRFTIVFTIEEDYKEIGIMKAIGLKNKGIKSIYMVKYFALALVGGSIGFMTSIPFTGYLMSGISTHIMMKTSLISYILSIVSVVFIILVIIGFCYMCTRKINKFTAIDAIRHGSTGERFSISRKLTLHKMKHLSTPIYLAFSDLICGFKKFIILMITFILGTVIIIIPINIINTLSSNDIITLFGLGKTDFNIGAGSFTVNYLNSSIDNLLEDIQKIEQKMKQEGVEVKLHPELSFSTKIYADNPDESKTIFSSQAYNYSTDNYTYLNGTAPKLENEIAITTVAAEYFKVGLGDTLNCTIGVNNRQFIVTALYQSMNSMGYTVRFTEGNKLNVKDCSGFTVYGEISNKNINKEEAINILKSKFPELKIKDSKEYLDGFMGSTISALGLTKNIILVVVLGVNFLITCLLVRMLITKELPEIAVLKSNGFKNKDIRKWQASRIAIILIISVLIGTLLANLSGGFLTSGIFRMMGATQITLKIEPLQVFVIYPIIILIVTMLAVLTSLGQARKTNIWEINNQE